jgi:hypothetical protein
MARQESDREDLLREATALVERVELVVPGYQEPVVCGFRRDGSLSLFFGSDPVYQFNTAGQLRRAYVAGRLVKAEQGRLAALSRERMEKEVHLVRRDLSDVEANEVVAAMRNHLVRLRDSLRRRAVQVQGQVPANGDLVGRVLSWLEALPDEVAIAARPNVR